MKKGKPKNSFRIGSKKSKTVTKLPVRTYTDASTQMQYVQNITVFYCR